VLQPVQARQRNCIQVRKGAGGRSAWKIRVVGTKIPRGGKALGIIWVYPDLYQNNSKAFNSSVDIKRGYLHRAFSTGAMPWVAYFSKSTQY
jgi:hypothetical protein